MKKILISLSCVFVLLTSGCSSYERSTEPGTLIQAQMPDMVKKIEDGDSFFIMLSQTNCSHCKKFKDEVLTTYITNHEITVYDVVLDKQESMDPVREFIVANPNPKNQITDDMSTTEPYTPSFYFIKDGVVKDIHIGFLEEKEFDGYIKSYQLDKVKE